MLHAKADGDHQDVTQQAIANHAAYDVAMNARLSAAETCLGARQ